jgi:hypothetical protein
MRTSHIEAGAGGATANQQTAHVTHDLRAMLLPQQQRVNQGESESVTKQERWQTIAALAEAAGARIADWRAATTMNQERARRREASRGGSIHSIRRR